MLSFILILSLLIIILINGEISIKKLGQYPSQTIVKMKGTKLSIQIARNYLISGVLNCAFSI